MNNQPALIDNKITIFKLNPMTLEVEMPEGYVINTPIAQVWVNDVLNTDINLPTTVDGQVFSFTLTVPHLQLFKNGQLLIKFADTDYLLGAPLEVSMKAALATKRIVVTAVPNIGNVRVSAYTDYTVAQVAIEQAEIATQKSLDAEASAELASAYATEAKNAATGTFDPAGTFNAATGVATQAQSDTYPAATFTPTISSTKPKGYFLDINVAGDTSVVTGGTIAMTEGGRLRSNGVGFPWTYVEPSDTGYVLVTDLLDKLPQRNLFNPAAATTGKVMTSAGVISDNAGYAMSEKIAIKPSTAYSGKGLDPLQMRYACYFAADGTTVVAGGWDGVSNDDFTSPATAYSVVLTVAVGDINDFQLEENPVPRAKVDYGVLVSNGMVKLEGTDVLTDDDHRFVSQAQIDSLESVSTLTENFQLINLADPADFTADALMQSTGVPVPSVLWIYTGNISVTAGETIFLNSDENTGSRYAAFYAADGTTVVAGGWDGVNTFSKVIPAGAFFIAASFPSAFASSVRVGVGASDPGYIPFGELYATGVHFSADTVAETELKKFVTEDEKATISTLSFLNTQFYQLELKGILQKNYTAPSPIYDDISDFVEVLLQGDEDITAEEDNGSISTGGVGWYCTPTANSNLLPEFCREENLWTKWVRYMLQRHFVGQKHARFDTAGVFTIGGTVTTTATNNDVNWGHQYPNGGDDFGGPNPTGQIFFDRYYQIITPTSGNASVTFSMPDSSYKLAWMLSYSHLSGTFTFAVTGGANQLEYFRESDSTWQELDGGTLDASTPDAFDAVSFTASGSTSTKIRRDQHSMPFKVRRKEGFTLSGNIAITATMGAGKRIEHWGIYHTRSRRLFIPVCSAKGSHALVSLRAFYPYGIDKRKPNLYIMGCPTINEWRVASVEPTDTPSAYAARFTSHATTMLGKSHIKAIYARIRAWHLNMNMYEAVGDMPTYYKTTEGHNNGFEYINKMVREMNIQKELNPGRMAVANLLPAYLNYNNAYAAYNGLTRRQAMYIAGGVATDSITMDGTHEGNVGNEVGYRAEVNNWNF